MNKQNNETKKSNKRGCLVLTGSAILLLAILVVVIAIFAEPFAKDRLEQEANQTLGPEMELVIGDLNIGYFPLSVTATNLDLFILENGESDLQWPNSHVESIQLSGINLWKLITSQDLNIGSVEITGAQLHLVPDMLDNIETNDTSDEEAMEIKIHTITLNESGVNIYRNDDDQAHTVIGGLDLSLSDLFLSPGRENLNEIIGSFEMRVGSASHVTEDGYYEVRSSGLHFELSSGDFIMDQFELIPLYSPHELPERLGHETDHFDISSQQISIRGIDAEKWFDSQIVSASAIEINDLKLEISRDKNFPDKPRTEDPLLNKQFANLEIDVSVDTLLWKGGSIIYREMTEGQNQFGEILFDDLDIEFFGIQNRNPEETIRATASAYFLGLSELSVDFEFFLTDNAAQNISGKLASMDLTDLNQVIEPLAFVRVKEGDLKSMTFEFTADDQIANGELIIVYDNLSLRILDEETLEQSTSRNIASFFANLLAIRSSNDEDDPRIGEIEFERESDRSMFNYWWKILRDGLMNSVARV